MKSWKRTVAAVISAAMLCSTAAVVPATTAMAAESIESAYEWGAMRIGGGGFVSGIVTGKEVMYARTDVGGAYKFNYETEQWEQLFGFLNDADKGLLSVDAMCIDPTDDNTVYFLCGCAYFSGARTEVIKTTDGGKTFERIDVTDLIQVHGNGYGRQCGESIAVDPDNPDVLYCGGDVASGASALIMSKDGGKTWTPVKGYDDLGYYKHTVNWPWWDEHPVRACTTDAEQAYNEQNGVSAIAIAGGKVYVGTSITGETNVVVAKVGSDKFEPLSSKLPENWYPSRLVLDNNDNLYITYLDSIMLGKVGGGVYKYNIKTGELTDVSPCENGIGEVYADPSDPDKLVAATCANAPTSQLWYADAWKDDKVAWGEQYFRSVDGGKTWEEITPGNTKYWDGPLMADYLQDGGYAWIRNKSIHWSGSIVIDPKNPDRFFTTSGNGVFRCDDIWSELPVYTFHPDGIEEVVALDFASTSDGLDLSAIGDYDGFVHNAEDEIGLQYQPNIGSTSAIAICAQNTDVWVRIAEHNNDTGSGFYTTDRGKTWNKMGGVASEGGKAAIVQIDKKTYRIFNTTKGGVSYSDDWGKTWTAAEMSGLYYDMRPGVFPDPENPEIVWAYGYSQASNQWDTTPTEYKLYKSTDGGKTFSAPTSICDYDYCDAATRVAYLGGGDLILGGGWHGMYKVTDGGSTVTKLPVYYCKTVGYGAPEKKGNPNALYMYGRPTEEDVEGIYRSTDGGETWLLINTQDLYGGTGNGNFLVGDMDEYGKVYMSTVGCGIVYGKIAGEEKKEPTTQDTTKGDNTVLYGDVDEDGDVDIMDVILLNRSLMIGANVGKQGMINADVDNNGSADATDSLNILKAVVQLITLPVK